ncbi:ParB/RepB/Spo0J family partition protein [Wohlfahrtiimonas larvae]|uniref:Probable chromosome-partitioning protein ParB n=1 Tax=Wohlfahrtiimonas larvae TaxID=1157986 RepID=A0ABP9MAT3_9GAMM|nr:ParB/RepB/Spo0J family partition protein [Wohlfahrtiimonas larvae]
MKKRGLGRGLDVLLNKTKLPAQELMKDNEVHVGKDAHYGAIKEMPIEFLVPGAYQPRKVFDAVALETLAESIKSQGIIQPLVVREISKDGQKKYEILAGERRWRASQIAELEKVPVIIQSLTDQEALAVALIENIQREDLNPIEEAEAIARFINEFELTHQEVGELIGRSRSSVSNVIRLLELADQVQEWLLERKIDMGHARALLPLDNAQQIKIAELIIQKSLTVRDVERLMKEGVQAIEKNKPIKRDPDVVKLENDLSQLFGAKVGFQSGKKGKGKMTIHYDSLDQLDGILQKIGVQ